MKPLPRVPCPRLLSILALCAIWILPVSAEQYSPLIQDAIKLTRDRLVYKNKSVKIPFTRDDLLRVFGKPSREIYNTAGTVVIWDELGLTCYGCQKKNTPEEFEFLTPEEKKQHVKQNYVDSVSLFVRKHNPYPEEENEYQHEPRYPFQGKLVLDGVDIDGITTFDEFLKLRKGKQTILLPENSFSFYIRCKPAPHEITLHTIRDKYDEDFMTIYSVSIRNVGHFYKRMRCAEVFSSSNKAPAGK
jgi:hypothetical protein